MSKKSANPSPWTFLQRTHVGIFVINAPFVVGAPVLQCMTRVGRGAASLRQLQLKMRQDKVKFCLKGFA
jgi:hypothetical protein